MRILAIADEESKYLWDYFQKEKLEGIDLILSSGDLNPNYLSFLATFTTAPVLYVRGNHDDKYEKTPPDGCICIEDQIYVHEGVRILGLGGSMRYRPGIKFYIIDGVKIGIETGMGPTRINTILQSAFFKLADIIPEAQAIELMKAAAKATYGRKGDDVVAKNWAAIDEGAKQVVEVTVPESWKDAADEGLTMTHATSGRQDAIDFVNNIQAKVSAQEGNSLPVSAFTEYVDGTTPSGTSAYDRQI